MTAFVRAMKNWYVVSVVVTKTAISTVTLRLRTDNKSKAMSAVPAIRRDPYAFGLLVSIIADGFLKSNPPFFM